LDISNIRRILWYNKKGKDFLKSTKVMSFKLVNTDSRRAYKGCKTLTTTNVYKSEKHPFWFIQKVETQQTKYYTDSMCHIYFHISDEMIGSTHLDFSEINSDYRMMEVQNIGWEILDDWKDKSIGEISKLNARISKINSILDKVK